MKPVRTKRDFVERYRRGEFGNASPTWDNFDSWSYYWNCKGWEGRLFHLRNRIAGGATYYNLDALSLWDRWREFNYSTDWYVSEMAPTHLTLFQGEVRRSTNHLDLYYSTYVAPMRESLAKGGKQVGGILASTLLKYYLNSSSYEWLQYLLDEYEDHTIEFSCYSRNWGTVPGMNTVFWEVRLY